MLFKPAACQQEVPCLLPGIVHHPADIFVKPLPVVHFAPQEKPGQHMTMAIPLFVSGSMRYTAWKCAGAGKVADDAKLRTHGQIERHPSFCLVIWIRPLRSHGILSRRFWTKTFDPLTFNKHGDLSTLRKVFKNCAEHIAFWTVRRFNHAKRQILQRLCYISGPVLPLP